MLQTSSYWCNHFKKNAQKRRVNWFTQPNITQKEKEKILYSLKAWQLGETSDGSHLLAASKKFAKKHNDPLYVEAVEWFIREEQKHGNNLGRYIDMIGEKRVKQDWGDTIFRKVRYWNTSMELWTITVIIVESAAQVFYKALHDATSCKLLKSICHDILVDEAHHIKFQNQRMHQIFNRKGFYHKAFSVGWYGLLFFGAIHAIWFGHKKAFKAGGVSKGEFMRLMYYKFFKSIQFLHKRETDSSKQGYQMQIV
jgi:hypothetical protein